MKMEIIHQGRDNQERLLYGEAVSKLRFEELSKKRRHRGYYKPMDSLSKGDDRA